MPVSRKGTKPRRAELERMTVGGQRVVYISAPLERAEAFAELTTAEREVARLVAMGYSNAEIGRARGASARTVANQLAAIFRKLGVGSRVELIGLFDR